jgi:hypothetical protein
MPPRWPRVPTRDDPAFRRLDDRVTFATHVAGTIAVNSGCWFFRILQKADWSWTLPLTIASAAVLLGHGIYVFVIADYSGDYYTQPDSIEDDS